MGRAWIGARRMVPLCALLGAGPLAACGAGLDVDVDEPMPPGPNAESAHAVVGGNGLTINGLTINGLTINGLTINGLTINGLTSDALAATTLAALRDPAPGGEVTRTFFRYVVSCALPDGHDVVYAWTDGAGTTHHEIALGAFNLAPAWETGALDVAGQEWVSACLFARTNALGVHVPISIRGDASPALAATPEERASYPYAEGAFWGNLFAKRPYGRSCSRGTLDASATTSSDLHNGRTCASNGCGLIDYIGPCFTRDFATAGQACFRRAANDDWVSDCSYYMTSAQPMNRHVITSWLRP